MSARTEQPDRPDVVPSDDDLARYEQAAEWLQALHTRGDDEKTLEAWIDWCARSPLNQKAFDEIGAVWLASGDGDGSSQPLPWQQQRVSRRRFLRRFPKVLAACVAGVVALGLGVGAWLTSKAEREESAATFASPRGVNTIESLADRSTMELGGGSRATVRFSNRTRHVDLIDGEIFVDVSKDPRRPFVVTAGRLQLTAIGTAFNVRRVGEQAVVTVTEGTVEVARVDRDSRSASLQASPRTRLQVGQQLQYREGSSSLSVRWVDPDAATAWRNGVLKFIEEPLSLVISSINRYSTHEIVIMDESIGKLPFTGTARVDRIENWLHALESVFPVTVVELDDGRRMLTQRVRASPERQEPDTE